MRFRQFVGVLLVGAVALVGCGDDDDGDTASTATTVESTATTSGNSNGNADDRARCAEAATAMAQAATDIPLALTGTSASLRESVDKFKAFADSGPSEIRSDLQTVAAGYDGFVKVLADAGYNPASGQAPSADEAAKIQAAANSLAGADFQAAVGRVQAYFASNCD